MIKNERAERKKDVKKGLFKKRVKKESVETEMAIPFPINELMSGELFEKRNNLIVSHGFVLGSAGTGVHLAIKKEMLNVILNMSADASQMIVIDPDNEYTGFIAKFGDMAEVINISANSKSYINPLDLTSNYGGGDADPIALKCDYVMSLVGAMMSVGRNVETVITPPQMTLVNRALRRVYRNLIEHDFDEAYVPTLLDFQAELYGEDWHSEDARIIAEAVERFNKDSMNAFTHHTNIDLNKRIIVFNTSELDAQLEQMGLMIILDFIWNKMVQKSNCKRTYLYIEEVLTLFANQFSTAFLKQLYKRGRMYGLVITSTSQKVKELLGNKEAVRMICNSNYVLILEQASEILELLIDWMNLKLLTDWRKLPDDLFSYMSDDLLSYMSMAGAGCNLLFLGSDMYFVTYP